MYGSAADACSNEGPCGDCCVLDTETSEVVIDAHLQMAKLVYLLQLAGLQK